VPLEFTVPSGARHLKINIWDRFGDHVHVLAEEISPAPGPRTVSWDFRDMNGEPLPPGAYIIRINIDGQGQTRMAFKAG
jgi:hypothetical protein